MLCGIFAWGLLFLAIFLYFTDSNPAQPAPSSFSFLETRRLLPAQGRQRAIMGASEGLPEGADARRGLPRRHPYGPLHAEPGDLRAWAPDGFENEDDFLSPQTGRTSQSALPPEDAAPGTSGGPEGALSARRARGRWSKRGARRQSRSAAPGVGEDGQRLYSSTSRALLRRLWKGDASARMLHPRLQKAMGAYLRANKHGVNFRGRRAAGRSRAELLCALRGRVRVRTLDGSEPPFSALGWRALVPAVPLGRLLPRGLRTCAVVTSAGAILNSSLGEEIGGSPRPPAPRVAAPALCFRKVLGLLPSLGLNDPRRVESQQRSPLQRLRAETGILRGAGGPGKGSPRPSHRPGLRTHLLQSPRCALTARSRACTPDDPLMWQEQEGQQGKPHRATSLRGQLQTGVCRMIIATRSRTKSLSLGSAESPTAGESIDLVGTVTYKVGTHPASGPQLQPGLPSPLLYCLQIHS